MTTIRLHNTASRTKEVFTPLDPSNVRMYVCGPTVYDRAHLGNARPVVVFDVLFRLLRHVYGADHVTYVRNFTDVDDKINAEALRRRQAGAEGSLEDLIRQRTEQTIGWYHADMDALGALRPSAEPRATEFIAPMVAMIGELIAKGHAYETGGHVLFDVRSYAEYGKLSGRSVDDMIAGARAETAPGKRDPMDFVLWKPSDAETPGWNSPWGRGRPGWHIECSAMSHELLGPAFDIHGGGIDLQFPHHENEIAQSRCAHPDEGFAKLWMHNEMLLVEGKKMSKSLGNFFSVRELLNKNISPYAIRMVLLQTHYRKSLDFTFKKLVEANSLIKKWNDVPARFSVDHAYGDAAPPSHLIEALADDLNTSLYLKLLNDLYKSIGSSREIALQFLASLDFIGLQGGVPAYTQQVVQSFYKHSVPALASRIDPWIEERRLAKLAQDFSRADEIRAGLAEAGVVVVDSPEGATWTVVGQVDLAALEALERRQAPFR